MRLVTWFIRHFPDGLYAGPVRRFFLWLYNHLSIGARIRARARTGLSLEGLQKTPRALAEVYQLGGLVTGIALVALVGLLPRSAASVVGIVALYRPFEIFLLAVNWLFIDQSKIHSYTRSVVLFGMNIVEVVLFYAAAYVGSGCVTGSNATLTALYSSLRTSVTIGPTATAELPGSPCCGALLMSQIGLSYFLAVAILAHAVGALRKREELANKPTA